MEKIFLINEDWAKRGANLACRKKSIFDELEKALSKVSLKKESMYGEE
ncbi:hypothetical protein [Desulfovibrio sp. JC022]|nr:hypothetical protein [Desulfovibrio sp. JC022]